MKGLGAAVSIDIASGIALTAATSSGSDATTSEDERYFIAVGSKENEELIYFHQEKITTIEAVSLLGGLNDARANPQGLFILRQYTKGDVRNDGTGPTAPHVIFQFDLTKPDHLFGAKTFQVYHGDIAVASESAVKPAQAVIALVGSMFAIANVFN